MSAPDEMKPGRAPAVERVFAALSAAAFLAMFGSTLLGVVARFLRTGGVEWSFEIAGIAFIWIVFLGIVLAELRGENVAFEALRDAAPAPLRRIIDIVAIACMGGMGLIFLVSGTAVWRQSWFVPTSVLRWPSGVTIAALLQAGACILAIAAIRAWRLRQPSTGGLPVQFMEETRP